MSASKKILYIFDTNDWNSRIGVARLAQKNGLDVILGTVGKPVDETAFKIHNIEKPSGILSALKMVAAVNKLIQTENPDTLHTVTLKYAFICGIAALPFPRLRKIYTLAGLGYLFHGHSIASLIMRFALTPFMLLLFRYKNTTLIFQNPDDMNLFLRSSFVKAERAFLIRGSGVDLSKFNPGLTPDDPPLILMPTRLVREKGIQVFIDAARILKKKNINAIFQIAGGETTHNPKAISGAEMVEMTKYTNVEWLGRMENIPELLGRATLIVYPSYYGEGIPRVLLESCAAGRAIVTTDHTGCREAVTHGINGLLVPIKDAQATADAIQNLLDDPQRRNKMAQLGRKRAESEFDMNHIAQKTLDVYLKGPESYSLLDQKILS